MRKFLILILSINNIALANDFKVLNIVNVAKNLKCNAVLVKKDVECRLVTTSLCVKGGNLTLSSVPSNELIDSTNSSMAFETFYINPAITDEIVKIKKRSSINDLVELSSAKIKETEFCNSGLVTSFKSINNNTYFAQFIGKTGTYESFKSVPKVNLTTEEKVSLVNTSMIISSIKTQLKQSNSRLSVKYSGPQSLSYIDENIEDYNLAGSALVYSTEDSTHLIGINLGIKDINGRVVATPLHEINHFLKNTTPSIDLPINIGQDRISLGDDDGNDIRPVPPEWLLFQMPVNKFQPNFKGLININFKNLSDRLRIRDLDLPNRRDLNIDLPILDKPINRGGIRGGY